MKMLATALVARYAFPLGQGSFSGADGTPAIRSVPRAARLLRAMACLLLAAVATATADTHYVDINSTKPGPPYTSWETAATDIQSAVDAASDGETVLVGDGTYHITSQIQIEKGLTVHSVNGRDATIIDANGNCRVLSLQSNEGQIRLSGFTITGGIPDIKPANGGGIIVSGSIPVEITDCIIERCKAPNGGGGISIGVGGGSAKVQVRNCIIRHNK